MTYHEHKPSEPCPVCSGQMKNITGNIYHCDDCDYTATSHQLARVYSTIRT